MSAALSDGCLDTRISGRYPRSTSTVSSHDSPLANEENFPFSHQTSAMPRFIAAVAKENRVRVDSSAKNKYISIPERRVRSFALPCGVASISLISLTLGRKSLRSHAGSNCFALSTCLISIFSCTFKELQKELGCGLKRGE